MSFISSMTGYANVKFQSEIGEVNIDIRSVNSRFLDFSYRSAEEFRGFESKIRELTAAKVARGKVEVRIYCTQAEGSAQSTIDEDALNNLLAMQRQVLAKLPGTRELSAANILTFPGILRAPALDQEAFEKSVLENFSLCLDGLIESRRREGAGLKTVLLKYCDQIDFLVNELRPKIPLILQNMKDKLTERLEEALTQTLSDACQISKEEINDRIRQEVTLYGIKIDVNEEMERLLTHVREIRRMMDKGGPVGRKLDFLMQELNREANTLGSKAASIDMTKTSVDLKLVIESMREQIQNLE